MAEHKPSPKKKLGEFVSATGLKDIANSNMLFRSLGAALKAGKKPLGCHVGLRIGLEGPGRPKNDQRWSQDGPGTAADGPRRALGIQIRGLAVGGHASGLAPSPVVLPLLVCSSTGLRG